MKVQWGKGYKINRILANIPDENKLTCLHKECLLENLETVQELIDAGVNINPQNDFGDTPLHYAAYAKNLEIASRLLYAGSDENIKNAAGCTAFDYLSKQQIFDLICLYANLCDSWQSETSSESSDDSSSDFNGYSSDYSNYSSDSEVELVRDAGESSDFSWSD